MPIKPENQARYPRDWPRISGEAKVRARWQCQHPGCCARQYSVGRWLPDAAGVLAWKPHADHAESYAQARQFAAEYSFFLFGDEPAGEHPVIVIVLTVAHLNHQPEDCRPENLAAMCQRHHLAYDHEHHRINAWHTRRARQLTGELFELQPANGSPA